jgi:hypothetical protein
MGTALKSVNARRQEYAPSHFQHTYQTVYFLFVTSHCTVQPFVEVSSTNDLLAKPLCVAPERSNVKRAHCEKKTWVNIFFKLGDFYGDRRSL